jgi:hypothetical protein
VGSRRGRSEGAELEGENKRGGGVQGGRGLNLSVRVMTYLGKLLQAATLIGVGQPRVILSQEGELVRVGGQHLSDPGRVLLVTRPGAGRRRCRCGTRRCCSAAA